MHKSYKCGHFICTHVFLLPDTYLEIAVSLFKKKKKQNPMLTIFRSCHTVYQSGLLFYIPRNGTCGLYFLHNLANTCYCCNRFKAGCHSFKESYKSFSTNPEFMQCHQVYREVKDVGIPGYVKKQNRNCWHGYFWMWSTWGPPVIIQYVATVAWLYRWEHNILSWMLVETYHFYIYQHGLNV